MSERSGQEETYFWLEADEPDLRVSEGERIPGPLALELVAALVAVSIG
jgi:hypothetical protein